jgi:hypothetical protein
MCRPEFPLTIYFGKPACDGSRQRLRLCDDRPRPAEGAALLAGGGHTMGDALRINDPVTGCNIALAYRSLSITVQMTGRGTLAQACFMRFTHC